MATKPVKSIEDLAKEVLDTQEGLKSLDDLTTLFATPQPPQAVQPVAQQAVEPAPAPTQAVAPTSPAPATAPSQGEPDVLDVVPDKFKDKDVRASVEKMAKSYAELEAALKREQDERANMQKIVESYTAPRQAAPAPIQVPQGADDIEDAAFFERPKETVIKLAERIAAQKVLQYHADMERARYIEAFRTQHPDFDQVRGEILEVLAARPDLDKDQRNLPIVYQMAKQLKSKKLDDLRSSLGLSIPAPYQTPQQSTPAPAQPVDREKMKEEILEVIKAELQKRKAAQALMGGSTPVSPTDRMNQAPTQKPLSPEDQILKDMMDSGPKKLAIELG